MEISIFTIICKQILQFINPRFSKSDGLWFCRSELEALTCESSMAKHTAQFRLKIVN